MLEKTYNLESRNSMISNRNEYHTINMSLVEYHNLRLSGVFGSVDNVVIKKTYYVGDVKFIREFDFTIDEFSQFKRGKGKKKGYTRVYFTEYDREDKFLINLILLDKLVS